jgi:hypothetical protein
MTSHGCRVYIHYLYAAESSVRVQDALDADVEFFAVAEEFVQFHFPQHRAQRPLRELRSRPGRLAYQDSWSAGLSGRDGGIAPSVILNSPLPLGGQILRRVAGRAILPLLKLLPARFRTHSIAGVPRV